MENVRDVLEGMEKINKIDTYEQARKIFGLPNLKDKVLCFMGSWERTKITPYMPTEEEEKEYIFEELALFEVAKSWWQKQGDFSFVAFREFTDNINYEDIDFDNIEKTKKKCPISQPESKTFRSDFNYQIDLSNFLTKNSLAYFELQQKQRDLIGHHINILPKSVKYDYIKHLKETDRLVDWHKINILCIDYAHFPYFVISHFLKYAEIMFEKKEIVVSNDLKPLYQLFRLTSPDVKMVTLYWLKYYIDKAFSNSLKVDDWDRIEFLSMNHLQNIHIPSFWSSVSKQGYLCDGNTKNLQTKLSDKQEDIRIFYSFESLLFYEFKNRLKRIKRCVNCGAIIGLDNPKYKGRYCPADSENYAVCCIERNRKRQKKHYNLTKI